MAQVSRLEPCCFTAMTTRDKQEPISVFDRTIQNR